MHTLEEARPKLLQLGTALEMDCLRSRAMCVHWWDTVFRRAEPRYAGRPVGSGRPQALENTRTVDDVRIYYLLLATTDACYAFGSAAAA